MPAFNPAQSEQVIFDTIRIRNEDDTPTSWDFAATAAICNVKPELYRGTDPWSHLEEVVDVSKKLTAGVGFIVNDSTDEINNG